MYCGTVELPWLTRAQKMPRRLMHSLMAMAICAVLGAVADGEGVDAGLLDELDGVEGVRVGAGLGEDVILLAAQDAELALDADAERVRVFDDLAGELYVLLEREGGAVYHDGGVAAVNRGDAAVEVAAVVEVEHHGYRRALAVLLYGVGDTLRADLLVLKRAVGEVHAAAHEGVGEIRALEYGGAAEGLVHLDNGLGLSHGVYVERALRVVVLFGGLHEGAKRNEHDFILLLFFLGGVDKFAGRAGCEYVELGRKDDQVCVLADGYVAAAVIFADELRGVCREQG